MFDEEIEELAQLFAADESKTVTPPSTRPDSASALARQQAPRSGKSNGFFKALGQAPGVSSVSYLESIEDVPTPPNDQIMFDQITGMTLKPAYTTPGHIATCCRNSQLYPINYISTLTPPPDASASASLITSLTGETKRAQQTVYGPWRDLEALVNSGKTWWCGGVVTRVNEVRRSGNGTSFVSVSLSDLCCRTSALMGQKMTITESTKFSDFSHVPNPSPLHYPLKPQSLLVLIKGAAYESIKSKLDPGLALLLRSPQVLPPQTGSVYKTPTLSVQNGPQIISLGQCANFAFCASFLNERSDTQFGRPRKSNTACRNIVNTFVRLSFTVCYSPLLSSATRVDFVSSTRIR